MHPLQNFELAVSSLTNNFGTCLINLCAFKNIGLQCILNTYLYHVYHHRKWYIAKNWMLCATFLPQKVSLYLQPLLYNMPRLKAAEFREITPTSTYYAFQGHSRSFKVTDFGTNRKLIYDFLLLINSNIRPILYRFRDIAVDRSKIAIFGYPSCV